MGLSHPSGCLVLLWVCCSLALAQVPQPTGINLTLPANLVPSDPLCASTSRTPGNNYCMALLSEAEVIRGFGVFYDANPDNTCRTGGGSWFYYSETNNSCCKTCRWNRDTAVASHLQPGELVDCPPCVRTYYETLYRTRLNTTIPVVSLTPYNHPDRCPYGIPQPSGVGNASLPVWLYNPDTDQCYYKSSFARGISGGITDATSRCATVNSTLVTIYSRDEDDFIRLNLLWTGFFGETYTGLKKNGSSTPGFDNTWRWPNGTALRPTDYNNFPASGRSFNYSETGDLCMEYLPQQPKVWNPFSCAVNKHYICKTAAWPIGVPYNGTTPPSSPPVISPPAGSSPGPSPSPLPPPASPCTGTPAAPSGAVGTVALINAGGGAICGYRADDTANPAGTGGVADNWYGSAAVGAACSTCAATPTLSCTACTVRFGGAFSYSFSSLSPGNRYTLRLTFSEVYWTVAGSRRFNVEVNGLAVLTGVDVYALAGARFTPVVREVNVTATSTSLMVTMRATADNAILAALEVYDMGPSGIPLPSPSASPSPPPATTPSPSPSPVPSASPIPSGPPPPNVAACNTLQPGPQSGTNYCPAMMTIDEIVRGFGAYYDPDCRAGIGGSWAVYSFPAGTSCCRTCRWNRNTAVAGWLQPTELADCPPCVQAYYESLYNGTVPTIPMSSVVNNTRCPFPRPSSTTNACLPHWLYNPVTDKCYFRSSAANYAVSRSNAASRCAALGATLLQISSRPEDNFVRLNLLWTGIFGECYTGLRKPGRSSAEFDDTWRWPNGTPLLITDYQNWTPGRGFAYNEDGEICMEYLPQQPNTWNPFSCAVIKHYVCDRPAETGAPAPSPSPSPSPSLSPSLSPSPSPSPGPSPSSSPSPSPPPSPSASPVASPPPRSSACPNQPANSSTVARVNAGGPALEYPAGCAWSGDTAASPYPGSTGGIGRFFTPGCDATNPGGPLACVDRWGGPLSYTFPAISGANYVVVVHMAECYWTGIGIGVRPGNHLVRIFINGQLVTVNPIDPFTAAGMPGGTNMPRLYTFNAQGTGAGNLIVAFDAVLDQPSVVALEVYRLTV